VFLETAGIWALIITGTLSKRKGFTLVELLVVIAIIAVLMVILMPALNRVKEQTRTTVCQSNMRQYGLATVMYTDDNEGNFPDKFRWLNINGHLVAWADLSEHHYWHDKNFRADGLLFRYLQADQDIHCCPTFATVSVRAGGCPINCPIPFDPVFSYSMNMYLGWNEPSEGYSAFNSFTAARKIGQVATPAKCFVFTKSNTWQVEYDSPPAAPTLGIPGGPGDNALHITYPYSAHLPSPLDFYGTYHNPPGNQFPPETGSANIVCVDGHAENVRFWTGYGDIEEARYEGFLRAWPLAINFDRWWTTKNN